MTANINRKLKFPDVQYNNFRFEGYHQIIHYAISNHDAVGLNDSSYTNLSVMIATHAKGFTLL